MSASVDAAARGSSGRLTLSHYSSCGCHKGRQKRSASLRSGAAAAGQAAAGNNPAAGSCLKVYVYFPSSAWWRNMCSGPSCRGFSGGAGMAVAGKHMRN